MFVFVLVLVVELSPAGDGLSDGVVENVVDDLPEGTLPIPVDD